jgi:hypothetical protein
MAVGVGLVARDVARDVGRHVGGVGLAGRSPQRSNSHRVGGVVGVFVVVLMVMVVGLLGGTVDDQGGCETSPIVIDDSDLARVLVTIRTIESGGDYTIRARGSTASGAYQIVDGTWAGFGGYPSAYLAPAGVQDAKAVEMVSGILARHAGDVTVIPVYWYLGHLPGRGSPEWDTVPVPEAGNVLTPRAYQSRWLATYDNPNVPATGVGVAPEADAGCGGVLGDVTGVPDGVTQLVASHISWGGYESGRIPLTAMRWSRYSNYLYPAASVAWDQLAIEAAHVGIDLTGNGYRPASVSSGASVSNHGWGLAIDVNALTGPNGFNTATYGWLTENAGRYGWINPAWAKPVSLGGTGRGGWAGGTCCHLEPWHWEWAAFLTTTSPT